MFSSHWTGPNRSALIKCLGNAYPSNHLVIVFATKLDISTAHINLSSDPITAWYSLVDNVYKVGKIDDLAKMARDDMLKNLTTIQDLIK